MLDLLANDLRLSVRALRRRPVFALTAILTLGLGIGVSTAMFSVVDAVLLHPLPLDRPDRLVWLWSVQPDQANGTMRSSEADIVDWQSRQTTFEGLVAGHNRALTLLDDGDATKLSAIVATYDFFSVLGPRFELGRGFDARDEGRDVAILSHRAWQRHFGGDPEILDRRLHLDGVDHDVVGVLPADFELPRDNVDIFLARRLIEDRRRTLRSFFVLGRLGEGVAIETAQAEMVAVAEVVAAENPESHRGWSVAVTPLHDHLVRDVRAPLWALFGAVGLLLAIACVNVAGLLLARVAERSHEIAVSRAIGASRGRIASRQIVESLVLAVAAGGIGWLVARLAIPWLLAIEPAMLPRAEEVGLDPRALGFTVLISLATGLLAGLVPTWVSDRSDLVRSLRRHQATLTQRTRGGLVVAEVALAVILVLAAGLLARSFGELHRVDPGFDADELAVVRIFGQPGALRGKVKSDYFDQLEAALAAVPGVASVGGATTVPYSAIGPNLDSPFLTAEQAPDQAADRPVVEVRGVTPTFFEALDVPLLRGRTTTAHDRAETEPVAVINRALADMLAADADAGLDSAVGQRLRVRHGGWRQRSVVGVVGDLRQDGPASPPRPEIYLPHTQVDAWVGLAYAVRLADTPGNPAPTLDTLRRAVLAFDPDQPPHTVTTMHAQRADQVARERFASAIASVLAILAATLASLGLYGVIAATVSSRRREIGVRMALGAGRRQIATQVVLRAVALVAAGLVLGSIGAQAIRRWLDALLYGVSSVDPTAWLMTCGVLVAVALVASWLPARHAMAVDPADVLRHE